MQKYLTRRNIIIAVLVVGAIILAAIIFQKCSGPDDTKAQKKEQAALTKVLQDKIRNDSIRIATIIRERDSALIYNDVLAEERNRESAKTDKVVAEANTLRKLYNAAKQKKDTVFMVEISDSVVLANEALTERLTIERSLFQQSDSLHKSIHQQDAAIIATQKASIESALRYGSTTNDKYQVALGQLSKSNKKNKRAKTLNRILAGAVVVLGGVVLMK